MLLKKYTFCHLLIALSMAAISQDNDATRFYHEAVKQSGLKKYQSADSLFTLSVDLEPHPDAYFNRAAVRSRLNNKKGRCEDLACAAAMDDPESVGLFCKECGKADTIYSDSKALQSWQAAYSVTYTSVYFEAPLIARHNSKKRLLGFGWARAPYEITATNKGSIGVEESPEFPGGVAAMASFIHSNLAYPDVAREAGIAGIVILKFTVNSFGYINEIQVLKGIDECKACDYEAVRVASIMPRWKPARLFHKNVDCYFTLPVRYKMD